MKARIVVSAVCVFDAAGRLLTVRKRGTDMFMHPGGKPEPGETAVQAAARELQEEVGIVVGPGRPAADGRLACRRRQRGRHGHRSHGVHRAGHLDGHPSAEIAEIRWLDLAGRSCPADLAPLLTDHILPGRWPADPASV